MSLHYNNLGWVNEINFVFRSWLESRWFGMAVSSSFPELVHQTFFFQLIVQTSKLVITFTCSKGKNDQTFLLTKSIYLKRILFA